MGTAVGRSFRPHVPTWMVRRATEAAIETWRDGVPQNNHWRRSLTQRLARPEAGSFLVVYAGPVYASPSKACWAQLPDTPSLPEFDVNGAKLGEDAVVAEFTVA